MQQIDQQNYRQAPQRGAFHCCLECQSERFIPAQVWVFVQTSLVFEPLNISMPQLQMWQRWPSLVTGWRSSSQALTPPLPRGSSLSVMQQMLIGQKNSLLRQQVHWVYHCFSSLFLRLMFKSCFCSYHQSVSCHQFLFKSERTSLGQGLHNVAVLIRELWRLSAESDPSFSHSCSFTHVTHSRSESALKLYFWLKICLRVLQVHQVTTCTLHRRTVCLESNPANQTFTFPYPTLK